MGCDIHLQTEQKINGKWICIDPNNSTSAYNSRSYIIFGILAGVREQHCQVFKEKGFPEDASIDTINHYEEFSGDSHTPSWLLLSELNIV